MKRMREKSGLTLVEILTVIAIIALLTGILIPAVTAVKDAAKEVKQKGQFMAIDLALATFKNDPELTGDYPDSYYGHFDPTVPPGIYCGSQKLTEALLGWDLAGFHPKSDWRWNGLDAAGGPMTYDPPDAAGNRVRGIATFNERKKPLLEAGTQNAFTLRDLFGSALPPTGGADTYVICDVYGATKVTLADGSVVKAGAPVLYYKADPTGRTNDARLMDPRDIRNNQGNIYNCYDNQFLIVMKETVDKTTTPFDEAAFYSYIQDPKIDPLLVKPTPYNPNSYILISAGPDGVYGTEDDVRNFGN